MTVEEFLEKYYRAFRVRPPMEINTRDIPFRREPLFSYESAPVQHQKGGHPADISGKLTWAERMEDDA